MVTREEQYCFQQLSLFIYDHPRTVENLLRKQKVYINGPTTYPKLDSAVLTYLHRPGFRRDLERKMAVTPLSDGHHYFIDPVSLGLAATAALTSVASAVLGAVQAKQVRQHEEALQLLQLSQNEEMQAENLADMVDAEKRQIITNTAMAYKQGLDLIAEKNKSQETAVLFFSITAISTAAFIHVLLTRF